MIGVPEVAAVHPTMFDVPAEVPIAIRYEVPPPPERVGVKDVVLIAATFSVVGTARKTDFPAKKLNFKLPDAAVGTVVDTVNGGGRVPASTFEPASATMLFPAGVPNTSNIELAAEAGAVLR